jgi:ligand-binding sensor domain-containing protein
MRKLQLIIVALTLIHSVVAQELGYRSFKLLEDDRSYKINTLYKTDEGYIYVGTTNGLYSFDGINFKRINFSRSNIKDTVTAIFQGRDHQLWVGFKNGHLAKEINGKLEYYQPDEGTPAVAITSFLQDKENNIWFATNGEGIYYFNNDHLFLIDTANGLSDLHIHALALAANGDVLAATDQGINICKFSKGKKHVDVIGPRNGLPDYYVTAITPVKGNAVFWIGLQEKGYCLYDHETGKITIPAAANNWNSGQVNAMLVSQNNLWIATDENGLFKQPESGQNIVPIKTGVSIDQNRINNLLQDNEGNIWMNTSSELISTAGDLLHLLPAYDKNVFENIHALLCDYQNNFWVSADGGLIKYSYLNGILSTKNYRLPELNSETAITSLYQDKHHHVWIGTMGAGILLLDPATGQHRRLEENPLLKNASILSITGNGNTVCAGGLEGVAMIFNITDDNSNIAKTYNYTNYNRIENIGNNYIYSIYKDSRGRIWFGTDGKGITVLENGKFTHYGKGNGLKDDHIYSFAEDANGNIWFNTKGAGIYRFDGKGFKNYSGAEGISDLEIIAIKAAPHGNIILVNKKGLDILDIASGTFSYLNNKQGIADVNTDFGSVAQDTSGNIAISTKNGIVIYSPVDLTTHRPNTVIENVQLFLTDVDKDKAGNYKYDQNSFLFNFTGIYYTNPDEVHYQYKLDGLDTAWILTRDRSISFLRLQPGKYKFHVRSSLNENFENADEATYEFFIEKPLWKRFWFIALCIIAGIALLYGYMKRREAHLKKMQQLQEEKTQFQFQVLRNQVNPHFLFNSFNTLISTIEENPAMAVGYVEQLSEFFRNIVTYRDKDVITLGEEINILQNYFFLQQKRYGNNLKMKIDIPENVKKLIFIPPLSLQLLLENAIKHNAVSKEKQLSVELYIENEKYLVIKNNINPKITKESGAGMGLQNITNRYNLLSHDPVIIKNDGIYFIVALPLLKQ